MLRHTDTLLNTLIHNSNTLTHTHTHPNPLRDRYGLNNEMRLTGKHETCDIDTFKMGVADRGSSIRIPLPVQLKVLVCTLLLAWNDAHTLALLNGLSTVMMHIHASQKQVT